MAKNSTISKEKKVTVFSGKGGVGKTTIAAATALSCALEGERTLIISTDPTPSLSHIFETKSGDKPAKVLENLYFNELGFEEVKQMWEAKFGREVYQIFSSFVDICYEEFTNHIITISVNQNNRKNTFSISMGNLNVQKLEKFRSLPTR